MAHVTSNFRTATLSFSSQSIRSKGAAALLALLPINGLTSQAQTTRKDEPPAASSADLGALALPKAEQVKQEQPTNRVILRNGFVIPQGDKTAQYALNEDGRVSSIVFPSGYTISRIVYHNVEGSEDRIASLSVTSGGVTRTYTRNTYGDQLYSSWKISGPGIGQGSLAGDFDGDFVVTSCGEFAIKDWSPRAAAAGTASRVFTAEERGFGISLLQSGGYRYLHSNGDLHGLRRADLSLVTVTYSNDKPSSVTEEQRSGATRVWRLESSSGLWLCSDLNVLPSRECPLFERGTLSYMTVDGSRVSVATSGAKTIAYPDGVTAVVDQADKIVRVAKGARSRVFHYNEAGSLTSFADYRGSSKAHAEIKVDPSWVWQIDQDGAVLLEGGDPSQARQATLQLPVRYESPAGNSPGRLFSLPRMLIHPHDPKSGDPALCLRGICPETPAPRDEIGIFLPTQALAIGQESLALPEISSWTTLDAIEKRREGSLAFVVNLLRLWAETTSDEDIDVLTSPESLRQLCSSGGTPWIQQELLSPVNADYLIWLRECIRANKLPCSLDVKVLNHPKATNQRRFGGVTETRTSPMTGELNIEVSIQALIYQEAGLRADIEAMKTHGGLGVFRPDRFESSSVFYVAFHELQHAFVYATGREFEGAEPVAHLGAFLALASITPEKAVRYESLLKSFRR